MFRVVRVLDDEKEILFADENKDVIENKFIETVMDTATNADQYTLCDLETIKEKGEEQIGSAIYKIDEYIPNLNDLKKDKCPYCESDNICDDLPEVSIDSDFNAVVTVVIDCLTCNISSVIEFSSKPTKFYKE